MITSLKIGNFKAFGETQTIPIRPITLIFGANSSGKSSILHALLYACHALETGDFDVSHTNLGGELIDIGGFEQFVHQHESTRAVELGFELDVSQLENANIITTIKPRIKRIGTTIKIGGPNPMVLEYELSVDDVLFMSLTTTGKDGAQIKKLNDAHVIFRGLLEELLQSISGTGQIPESLYQRFIAILQRGTPYIDIQMHNGIPKGFSVSEIDIQQLLAVRELTLPITNMQSSSSTDLNEIIELIEKLLNRGYYTQAGIYLKWIMQSISDFIYETSNALLSALSRLTYLGPLRTYPARSMLMGRIQDSSGDIGGLSAWDILRKDEGVREEIKSLSNIPPLEPPRFTPLW